MSKKNGKAKVQHYAQQKEEREDKIEFEGIVEEVLPGTNFRVRVRDSESIVLCNLAGKLRQNRIRILLGDRVKLEVSPYDLSRGRVTWRLK